MRMPDLSVKAMSDALKISNVRLPSEPGEMSMLPMWEVMPNRASVVLPS